MGEPYVTELEHLPAIYAWSRRLPVDALSEGIRHMRAAPLLAIGSGGSYSAAAFAAYLHQLTSGLMAKPVTPYEAVHSPLDLRGVNVLMLTAGGDNPDILGSFSRLVEREPRSITVICTRSGSALAELVGGAAKARFFEFDIPTGKDGFLATNSLIATAVMLARGFDTLGRSDNPLPEAFCDLLPGATSLEAFLEDLARRSGPLWGRPSFVLLHTPATQPAALDLESRFSEAAIAGTQVTDYRNFAHGRHYWLARHPRATGLIAWVTAETSALADRTLRLPPGDLPVLRIDLPEEGVLAALAGLVHSLYLTRLAGEALGLDPGRPVVPLFGRRLYHLNGFRPTAKRSAALPAAETAAIERKSRKTWRSLESGGEAAAWREAYGQFVTTLLGGRFSGLAFDYDGTLCDSGERFLGPRPEVSRHLNRLLGDGIVVGIATGRGKSVKEQLRCRIERAYWERVIVAYYNGAEVGLLAEDGCPSTERDLLPPLAALKERLDNHPVVAAHCVVETNRNQLTLLPRPGAFGVTEIWQLAASLLGGEDFAGVRVLRSDHSVDIVRPGISKVVVVGAIGKLVGDDEACKILCLGDKGAWPGNDCDLLGGTYSLSVDETSFDPRALEPRLARRLEHGRRPRIPRPPGLQVRPGLVLRPAVLGGLPMRDTLAEKLLVRVMGWERDKVKSEVPLVLAMASYKFDEYQQFFPGMRFVESLARWLRQFDRPEDRDAAYEFVKDRLIFCSSAEMRHFVEMAYPDHIRPLLLRRAATEIKQDWRRVGRVAGSVEFRVLQRRCLFLGLSDGARIDQFRRANPDLSHEQIWQTHELADERVQELLDKLDEGVSAICGVPVRGTRFSTVVLLDDFSASGRSYYMLKDDGTIGGVMACSRCTTTRRRDFGADPTRSSHGTT